ncbi:MAG: hypothetical protein H0U90_02445 [Actinobacteria bacterium]|nr:hypothetical protein [Actinomycetota bacterium]
MRFIRYGVLCAVFTAALAAASPAWANHPVLVEGNCLDPPAGNPGSTAPGTCGDYDGDTRIGTPRTTTETGSSAP